MNYDVLKWKCQHGICSGRNSRGILKMDVDTALTRTVIAFAVTFPGSPVLSAAAANMSWFWVFVQVLIRFEMKKRV